MRFVFATFKAFNKRVKFEKLSLLSSILFNVGVGMSRCRVKANSILLQVKVVKTNINLIIGMIECNKMYVEFYKVFKYAPYLQFFHILVYTVQLVNPFKFQELSLTDGGQHRVCSCIPLLSKFCFSFRTWRRHVTAFCRGEVPVVIRWGGIVVG